MSRTTKRQRREKARFYALEAAHLRLRWKTPEGRIGRPMPWKGPLAEAYLKNLAFREQQFVVFTFSSSGVGKDLS